jgi:hypothetical protein
LLRHHDPVVANPNATTCFHISDLGIGPFILDHRPVGTEANLGIALPHCFCFGEDEEPTARPGTLTRRIDGYVVEQCMVWLRAKDRNPSYRTEFL